MLGREFLIGDKMTIESISTEPIKEKLRNLSEYMPDQDETTYQFGRFLAERLGNDTILPMGFNMVAELGLYDLQTGIDGFTGEPIRSRLVGNPPMIYGFLRMIVPEIADAVCPEDFAKGVRKMYDEVNAKLREEGSRLEIRKC